MPTPGVLEAPVRSTPIAILDFETTGLSPGRDRVVEVSVVRLDPGRGPRLAFDSLIDPRRRVACSEVHGITDRDVADAPTFEDVAGQILAALSGCVVASYNIYFDMGFFEAELRDAGRDGLPPHLCVMYMRPLLGLGKRCSLEQACQHHGVEYAPVHQTAVDAAAAAALMRHYLRVTEEQGLRTFGDLASLGSYKFVESFRRAPIFHDDARPGSVAAKSRPLPSVVADLLGTTPGAPEVLQSRPVGANRLPDARYWDALTTALVDLDISEQELSELSALAALLDRDQIRAAHARAFAASLNAVTHDQRLNDDEVTMLERVRGCLAHLGWAP